MAFCDQTDLTDTVGQMMSPKKTLRQKESLNLKAIYLFPVSPFLQIDKRNYLLFNPSH